MKKKKRPITLLEIMIVIFLIGIIGSVIGYNMKGSMDKGKAFKTEHAMKQIEDILLLQVSDKAPIETILANPSHYLKTSGMVKDPNGMLKDGWGQPFEIRLTRSGTFKVSSSALLKYKNKQRPKNTPEIVEKDDDNEDD